jgi:hypothetical protein
MRSIVLTVMLLAATALAGGCVGSKPAHPDSLGGKITTNGQPVRSIVVTVSGSDGKSAGGMTNEEGVYLIPDPPKGKLAFQLSPPGGKATFPRKYTKPNNGLAFEYTGGTQTYDLDLRP